MRTSTLLTAVAIWGSTVGLTEANTPGSDAPTRRTYLSYCKDEVWQAHVDSSRHVLYQTPMTEKEWRRGNRAVGCSARFVSQGERPTQESNHDTEEGDDTPEERTQRCKDLVWDSALRRHLETPSLTDPQSLANAEAHLKTLECVDEYVRDMKGSQASEVSDVDSYFVSRPPSAVPTLGSPKATLSPSVSWNRQEL
ncbi:hypothetical protein BCR39DRAFT_528486 [Naematelia encephala]|uniref:Uncharacterized protein n=1 Tax=Naematelia encephala TaxID=71784 RepID=A0A1Y2B7Z1_9TREE|nr:hypothetical protein BCR39DRAFT_528486 [Naematelia encephala]